MQLWTRSRCLRAARALSLAERRVRISNGSVQDKKRRLSTGRSYSAKKRFAEVGTRRVEGDYNENRGRDASLAYEVYRDDIAKAAPERREPHTAQVRDKPRYYTREEVEADKDHCSHDLPLPPFMREERPPRHDRYSKRFADLPYIGSIARGNVKTKRQNIKRSPFAAAFAANPYAHALAGPVRECAFTNMRLPRACLIDFHIAEVPAAKGTEVQMLPLSIAAGLVPRNQTRETLEDGELEAAKKWEEESGRVPTGSASYMLAKREAVEFVSKDPKKRLMRFGVGRRTQMMLEKDGKRGRLVWREDMPELILQGMRKVLLKKLKFPFSNKSVADKVGLVQAMPGTGGLDKLDQVDNVQCVLRLTPSDNDDRTSKDAGNEQGSANGSADEGETAAELQEGASSATPTGFAEDSNVKMDASDAPDSQEQQTGSHEAVEGSHEAVEGSHEAVEGSHEAVEDSDGPERALPDDEEVPDEEESEIKVGSKTQRHQKGSWQRIEAKTIPFMEGVRPLPPPASPSELYFPTMRYRNRRVPAYIIPHLLGKDKAAALVKGTVFEGATYVTLTLNRSLLDAQDMLLKMHTYLAEGKDTAVRI